MHAEEHDEEKDEDQVHTFVQMQIMFGTWQHQS